MFKFLLPIIFLTVFATSAQAENMAMVKSEDGLRDLVARVYDAPARKFLVKELNGPNGTGFRIVFSHEGKTYTVDHDWYEKGIQVWVRRSKSQEHADVFGDSEMTAVVDYGSASGLKYFSLEEDEGSEHQPYWQEEYNKMLIGLEIALDRK